jgi:hypothetical protein
MQKARFIIENLLTQGKLEAAIEGSMILCQAYQDDSLGDIAAQHSARYQMLIRDYNEGLLNEADYRPGLARINRAMLDLADAIPETWSEEPLIQAGFSSKTYEEVQPGKKRVQLLKWAILIGLAVLTAAIWGGYYWSITNPKKEVVAASEPSKLPQISVPEQSSPIPENKPDSGDKPENRSTQPAKTLPKSAKTPETLPKTSKSIPGTLATPDTRFRSFGKTVISDNMELGKVGESFAYRNVKTGEILCCFADAKSFGSGKAYVSKDRINFYYIDKSGKKVD